MNRIQLLLYCIITHQPIDSLIDLCTYWINQYLIKVEKVEVRKQEEIEEKKKSEVSTLKLTQSTFFVFHFRQHHDDYWR